MLKGKKICCLVVLMGAMSVVQLHAYTPVVHLFYSEDGVGFADDISKHLYQDTPFYLRLKCACVYETNPVNKLFSKDFIRAGIAFRAPILLDVKVTDSRVRVEEEVLGKNQVFWFDIPVSSDGGKEVEITFYCEPKRSGEQEVRIAYEGAVSDTYQSWYTLIIKEN